MGRTSGATAVAQSEEIDQADYEGVGLLRPRLALELIVESPKNPRRHYDPASMQDLVDSIKAGGVREPVIVRPASRGDRDVFELGAGHRRVRAARLAGLTHVPAIVRVMDAGEFLEMLTISNLQREDVNPIEEAEGYQTLLSESGYDVSSLALKLGKSDSYVYGRLKLLALAPAVREALARDLISLAHATELGKVDVTAQLDALRTLFNLDVKKLEAAAATMESEDTPTEAAGDGDGDDDDFDEDFDDEDFDDPAADAPAKSPQLQRDLADARRFAIKSYLPIARPSIAELRQHMVSKVYVQLSRAPFDRTDATLVAAAGACALCPKRSGATQSLFPELEGNDVCLDRACFHSKTLAHIEQVAEKEREAHPGVDVVKISAEYGKAPKGVLKAGLFKPQGPATGEAPTKKARIGVYIDGEARGTAVWIKAADELIEKAVAGKSVNAVAPPSSSSSSGADDWKERQRRQDEERAKRQAGVNAMRQKVMDAMRERPLDAVAFTRMMLTVVTMGLGTWHLDEPEARELLTQLAPDVAAAPKGKRRDALLEWVGAASLTDLELFWFSMGIEDHAGEEQAYVAHQFGLDATALRKEGEKAHVAELKAIEKAKAKAAGANTAEKAPAKKKSAKRAKAAA